VKIRDEGVVKNKAVYLAIGITRQGTKDILGLWIEPDRRAKFWLKVMTELKNRGVQDALICLVDGLKGFRSDRGRVSAGGRFRLHRASDAPQSGVTAPAGSQARSGRAQINLPGGERRGRRPGAVGVSRSAAGVSAIRRSLRVGGATGSG